MPLPFILGAAAAIAGAAGVGCGIHGAVKMKEAQDTMSSANYRHQQNIKKFEETNADTTKSMDELGKLELNILNSFDRFSYVIEKIQNRPEFKPYQKDGISLPKYEKEKLNNVSVGAGVLLGGLGGAAAGTAGGFAAAGAATAAVMALGTASTGTAIASLSGAAAVNATLAALGGGAIAAGGGGIALGTTILGVSTLGVGLLVGGVIFNITGGKLSEKADEAYAQMKRAEAQINTACNYLVDLKSSADAYGKVLREVNEQYEEALDFISYVVFKQGKTDWMEFSDTEQTTTENTVLLVALLYKMCQVNLVESSGNDSDIRAINHEGIRSATDEAHALLADRNLQ